MVTNDLTSREMDGEIVHGIHSEEVRMIPSGAKTGEEDRRCPLVAPFVLPIHSLALIDVLLSSYLVDLRVASANRPA